MNLYQIIQEIKATRSRNDKIAILQANVDNTQLKDFLFYSLDPFVNFFQKKKFTQKEVGTGDLSEAMTRLYENVAKRVVTGNAAIKFIQEIIDSLSVEDASVILLILQKDSGCDLGASTINKVWPKLISTFPCLLATAYDDKLAAKMNWAKGVYSQTKSDGLRVNIVIDSVGGVTLYTRAGNELNVFGHFDCLGSKFKSVVFDGELMTIDTATGKFNNRQTSNGICNKAVKGTMSKDESDTLHAVVWDKIPLEDFKREVSNIQYKDRLSSLQESINSVPEFSGIISLIPNRIIHSVSQAQQHFQEMLLAGEEGTMIKDMDIGWSDTRSNRILKLKSENTGDFEVIGFSEGLGKLVGNLGALDVATSDRKCLVSISGFSMKLRSEIYANLTGTPVQYSMVEDGTEVVYTANPGDSSVNIGSIVEVMYNQKILARDSDVYSVFLPRFKTERQDKTIANSIDELK